MRRFLLTSAGVLLVNAALCAQQPVQQTPAAPQAPQAPLLDPANNRLDAHLLRWEQEMKAVQALSVQITHIRVDKTLQVTEVYEGVAKYVKPNLALLEMQKKGKPEIFEKYVCTGTHLWEYVPANKVVRVHEMPPPKAGQVADDSFLSFLFGMKAEESKRRYDMKLVKEDQWYIYIEIVPRLPADKADFQKARMVLHNKSFLPRELWFEQPNGNEIKWDIPRIENGAKLNRAEFTSPPVPQGWKIEQAPRAPAATTTGNVPPRVIRPNQ